MPHDAFSIPYDMDVSSYPHDDGDWVCRLEYVEIPGCVAESRDPLVALAQLEAQREQWIRERMANGEEVRGPRPPLTA
ncbi:hypothetical protein [Amycolatopsis sp. GM8]|uniref:hypothetical protein n=1 Tax=Amycolatopsis sp. GM8 TaxID=2896530 RepID=UPI001F3A7EB4|nr:hypothetical protein [Amycolatopsis sp. GM8]